MPPADAHWFARHADVERLACGFVSAGRLLLGCRESCFDELFHLVETFASGRLVGFIDFAEALLYFAEQATLGTEKLDAGSFERIGTLRRSKRILRLLG
jgi:hypothetical protein